MHIKIPDCHLSWAATAYVDSRASILKILMLVPTIYRSAGMHSRHILPDDIDVSFDMRIGILNLNWLAMFVG